MGKRRRRDVTPQADKLFAVYLGGRAPKCNTELHDVVFVTGKTINDTYEQLMDKWFGTPKGLHLDSWAELDVVDGYKVTLAADQKEGGKNLYFVNLGAYKDNEFTEIHANAFLVADSVSEAKTRAKEKLLHGWTSPVHTDDLYEVDSCMVVGKVNHWRVVLTKTDAKENINPVNGYHIIPKALVEDYMKSRTVSEPMSYREDYR